MNESTPLVVVEEHGAYAVVRINRASKRNAMNTEARQALRWSLRELEKGGARVIVITGSSASFCSGIDLKELGDSPDARKAGLREWVEVLLEIRRHPAIIISAVNGLALGGGVSLINASDLAIVADEAEMGLPEMGFGTYPAMAGPSTQMMLTPKRAAWLVLTAKRIDGATAELWGLVNRSVPLADLEREHHALAAHICQFDPVALKEAKKALEMVPRRINDWSSALEFGQGVNEGIRALSNAPRDGLARFDQGKNNSGQGKIP